MAYTPYYPDGWDDSPSTSTPIVAAALDNMEAGIGAAGAVVSGASYPDQLPALSSGLLGAAGITAVQAAIAGCDIARCNIVALGDSVTEGEGATLFAGRWAAQATRRLRLANPTTVNGSTGGYGFIPVRSTGETSYTWPITANGGAAGWGTAPQGPVRGAAIANSSGNLTFTAPASTTSAQVMFYANGDDSQFSYQVNSGAVTTETVSASTGDGALTSSISISGGQVLTVSWVSGTVYLEGIVHYAGDENSGIAIHGCGRFGWQAGETGDSDGWNQSGYGAGYDWQPSIAALNPAAILLFLGINDAKYYSASAYQANTETLVSGLRATSGLATTPIIPVIPYEATESFISAWSAYCAAIRALAAADTVGAQVIDLNYRMPAVSSGALYGNLYSDDWHPNDRGHALVGKIIAEALS